MFIDVDLDVKDLNADTLEVAQVERPENGRDGARVFLGLWLKKEGGSFQAHCIVFFSLVD